MKQQSLLGYRLYLVSVVLFILGCHKDPVELVKSGVLDFDKSVTVAGAFDNCKYLEKKEWKAFRTEQKRLIVEFTGEVALNAYRGASVQEFTYDDSTDEPIRNIEDMIQTKIKDMEFVSSLVNSAYYSIQFAILKDRKSFGLREARLKVMFKNGKEKSIYDPDFETVKSIFRNRLDTFTLNVLSGIVSAARAQTEKGSIEFSGLHGYFVMRGKNKRIFVIEGRATNRYQSSCSSLSVAGSLFDDKGDLAAKETVYCGNILKLHELQTYSKETVTKRLVNANGSTVSNTNVEPSHTVPFMIVFFEPPANISEFTVEMIDLKKASAKAF